MLQVIFDNGQVQEFSRSEDAEQAIQDVICAGQAESAELQQDGVTVAEYSNQDFDC